MLGLIYCTFIGFLIGRKVKQRLGLVLGIVFTAIASNALDALPLLLRDEVPLSTIIDIHQSPTYIATTILFSAMGINLGWRRQQTIRKTQELNNQ